MKNKNNSIYHFCLNDIKNEKYNFSYLESLRNPHNNKSIKIESVYHYFVQNAYKNEFFVELISIIDEFREFKHDQSKCKFYQEKIEDLIVEKSNHKLKTDLNILSIIKKTEDLSENEKKILDKFAKWDELLTKQFNDRIDSDLNFNILCKLFDLKDLIQAIFINYLLTHINTVCGFVQNNNDKEENNNIIIKKEVEENLLNIGTYSKIFQQFLNSLKYQYYLKFYELDKKAYDKMFEGNSKIDKDSYIYKENKKLFDDIYEIIICDKNNFKVDSINHTHKKSLTFRNFTELLMNEVDIFKEIIFLSIISLKTCNILNIVENKLNSQNNLFPSTNLILSEELSELLNIKYVTSTYFNLPLICEPNKLINKNLFKFQNLNNSGYYNPILKRKYPFYRDRLDLKIISDYKFIVDRANYLQSLPLQIDDSALFIILSISINKLNDFSFEDIDLNYYIDIELGIDKPKNHKYYEAQKFLLILFISDLFKDINIYSTYYICNRFRIYSYGYPLNFQGSKNFRQLFKLPNKTSISYSTYLHLINNNNMWVNHKRRNICGHYPDYSKNDRLIPNDAPGSIFQISSGLALDVESSFYTNIILNKKGEKIYNFDVIKHDDKDDIYTFLLKKLKQELDYDLIESLYVDFFYNAQQQVNDFFLSPNLFMEKLNVFLDRKFIKSNVMPFSYNKSSQEMIKSFMNSNFIKNLVNIYQKRHIDNKPIFKIVTIIINKIIEIYNRSFPTIKLLKDILKNIATLGSLTNEGCFISLRNNNNNIEMFGNDLIIAVDKYNNNDLDINRAMFDNKFLIRKNFKIIMNYLKKIETIKNLSFLQTYYETENIVIRKVVNYFDNDNNYVKKRFNVKMQKIKNLSNLSSLDKLILDQKKNQLSLYPNMAQYIDASLLYSVVYYCEINNIPIYVIHDCFYSHINYSAEIKFAYSLAYYKLIGVNSLKNIYLNFLDYSIEHDNSIRIIVEGIKNKKKDKDILKEYLHSLNFDIVNEEKIDDTKELFKKKLKLVKKINKYILSIYKSEDNISEFHELLFENLIKNLNFSILTND